jgi:S1-C subfamily serine protease
LAGAFGVGDIRGALVAEVIEDSPGGQAGVRAGDVILSVASFPVRNMQDFYNIEGQLRIGEENELEFLRGKQKQNVTVGIAALKQLDGGSVDYRLKGAWFEEIPAKQRADHVNGVLIATLERNSQLARNGLRPGDIVTGANRQGVQNLSDLQSLVKGSRGPILLQIYRNGENYIARID